MKLALKLPIKAFARKTHDEYVVFGSSCSINLGQSLELHCQRKVRKVCWWQIWIIGVDLQALCPLVSSQHHNMFTKRAILRFGLKRTGQGVYVYGNIKVLNHQKALEYDLCSMALRLYTKHEKARQGGRAGGKFAFKMCT